MSATVSAPTPGRWLSQALSRQPHQSIGAPDRPYLLRWFLISPNRWCNVYLHRFIGSDDPTPHDHPWNFLSIILRGSYVEDSPGEAPRRRRAGDVAFRRAEHRHRVILEPVLGATDGTERPCTTLIITGPHRRPWGFWCAGELFIPWENFGPGGCGEPDPPHLGG
jgi:hypothetical protein